MMNDQRAQEVYFDALLSGDPGGAIERQEKRGQEEMAASSWFPKTITNGTREQLEALGFEYVREADELFWEVRLPDGWEVRASDHAMWSYLHDDQGRERAAIFYKAAFYDRVAELTLSNRFSAGARPINGWDSPTSGTDPRVGYVEDSGRVIFITEPTGSRPEREDREALLAHIRHKELLAEMAKEWLTERFPDWRNPLAYWELPPVEVQS